MPPSDCYILSQHEKGVAKSSADPEEYKESCWPCRITSGFGLIGGAGYIGYHLDKSKSRYSQLFMICVASALVTLGTARLFDFPPFGPEARADRKRKLSQNKSV